MEVGVIYQSESIIDENGNFKIEFKKDQEIVELIFKKNRDYYLANAAAFLRNTFEEEIYKLEEKINKAETTFPFPPELQIDYTNKYLLNGIIKKYDYVLQNTSKDYIKEIKYFDTENEVVKKKNYDVISRLNDGITYSSKYNNLSFIKYLYTDIKFKLTPARKIEIRLTKSSDTSILTHYYKLKNGVFYRRSKNNWIEANVEWFEPVQSIYKQTLFQTKSLWQANLQSCKFIYRYYENRPKSEIIGSGLNYKSAKYPLFLFNSRALPYGITIQAGTYAIFVLPESQWFKKRSYNALKYFDYKGIMRFSDFKYPNVWLAQFNYNKTTSIGNLDFTQCWSMDTELKMDKKIIGNDILQTDYFSENEKDIIASSELNKYKLDNLKIKGNDFTNLNKTIKPTEFAFFYMKI